MLIVWALLFYKVSFYFFSYICFFQLLRVDFLDMFQKYGGATSATISPFVVELYRMIDNQYPSILFSLNNNIIMIIMMMIVIIERVKDIITQV